MEWSEKNLILPLLRRLFGHEHVSVWLICLLID